MSAPMDVSFKVLGHARPQGSKDPMLNPHTGKVYLRESSKGLLGWRAQVAHEAACAWPGGPVSAPVTIHVTFVFDRPKAHFRTGKFAHVLKPSAPALPTSRALPDLDKTCRAVFDAITGTLIADDSQVVCLIARKVFGWPERCEISCGTGPAVLDYDEREAAA